MGDEYDEQPMFHKGRWVDPYTLEPVPGPMLNETDVKGTAPSGELSLGELVSEVTKKTPSYLQGLVNSMSGGTPTGVVANLATSRGNPVGAAVRDAVGTVPGLGYAVKAAPASPLAALVAGGYGALTGQGSLDQAQVEQEEFRANNPVMSGVAERAPAAVAEGLLTGGASVPARMAAGGFAGFLTGANDELQTAALQERPPESERALAGAALEGAVGGGGAAVMGWLANKFGGMRAAESRLIQAGLNRQEINNIAKSQGIEAAAKRLRETGVLPRLGQTGVVDPEKLIAPSREVFEGAARAGKEIAVDPQSVLSRLRPYAETLGTDPTEAGEQGLKALNRQLTRMPEEAFSPEVAMKARKSLMKLSDDALKANVTPRAEAAQAVRSAYTGALDEALDTAGVDLGALKQARSDFRLGSTLEDAATRNLRSTTMKLKPGMGGTIVGANTGIGVGVLFDQASKRAPAIQASIGDALSPLVAPSPRVAQQALAAASKAGPKALTATVNNLLTLDPKAASRARKKQQQEYDLRQQQDMVWKDGKFVKRAGK